MRQLSTNQLSRAELDTPAELDLHATDEAHIDFKVFPLFLVTDFDDIPVLPESPDA